MARFGLGSYRQRWLWGVPVLLACLGGGSSPAQAACAVPAGNEGDVLYNADDEIMQWCDGTNWKAFNKSSAAAPPSADPCDPVNTPTAGQVCADGTVYADLSPDGTVPMYAARCDYGMTWNGTACTGSRGRLTWNDGSTNWSHSDTTAESLTDGDGNTAILEDWEIDGDPSDRLIAGRYCGTLSANGHSDWYLPAADELQDLYDNRAAIGNFSSAGTSNNTYWSSTDDTGGAWLAWAKRFYDATPVAAGGTKNQDRYIRCVRQGYVARCQNPFGQPGDLMYNHDFNVLQWCGGGVWHAAGKEGPALPANSVFADAHLRGHWKFDDDSGTAAADSSPNNYTGTLTNMVTPGWTTGRVGNALSFDGTDDYVDVGTGANLKPSLPVSVSAWIKLPPGGTGGVLRPIFRSDYQENIYSGFWIGVTATGEFFAEYGDGGAPASDNRRSKVGTTVLAGDTWYHVLAVIRGAADMDLYINFGDDGGTYSGTGAAMAYGGGSSRIGMHDASNGGPGITYFSGVIDDVRVYATGTSGFDLPDMGVASCNVASCGESDTEHVTFVVQAPSNVSTWVGGGGIAAADNMCQSQAHAYGLKGAYKAWLADSDPDSAPAFRFEIAGTTLPIVRAFDGVKIADNWADLTDGTLDAANDVRINGSAPANAVRTNVNTDGTQYSNTGTHCDDYTYGGTGGARVGIRTATNSTWTNNGGWNCNSTASLYCFEQNMRCLNPAGKPGDLMYNADYQVPQFCNGYEWVAVGPWTSP